MTKRIEKAQQIKFNCRRRCIAGLLDRVGEGQRLKARGQMTVTGDQFTIANKRRLDISNQLAVSNFPHKFLQISLYRKNKCPLLAESRHVC